LVAELVHFHSLKTVIHKTQFRLKYTVSVCNLLIPLKHFPIEPAESHPLLIRVVTPSQFVFFDETFLMSNRKNSPFPFHHIRKKVREETWFYNFLKAKYLF